MGYDTYNAFNCNYTGALATEQARLMHEYGLVDAGYNVCMQFTTLFTTRS
jgi:alpha-galactosidase